MTTFYLPINSGSVTRYFGMGIVCPASSIENKIEDLQDKYPATLLLCKQPYTTTTNCSLELVLTVEETSKVIKVSENFYSYNKPLPISRVKKVLFIEREQLESTLWNINKKGGDAFLPEYIAAVKVADQEISVEELEVAKIDIIKNEWTEKIRLFDHFLGGYALMRLGGEDYMGYSLNYFNCLGLLNRKIGKQVGSSGLNIEKNYKGLIIKGDPFREIILSELDLNTIKADAKDSIKLNRLGNFQFSEIKDRRLYFKLLVASYGAQGANKTIDNFFSDFNNDMFTGKEGNEAVALNFGINKGYDIFRNDYSTANFDFDVKFKLDSQVDYYTIESVYQFIFNDITTSVEFPYLDTWCPKFKQVDSLKGFKTYSILDKHIIYDKKVTIGSPTYLETLFENSKINELYHKIIEVVSGFFPPFMSKDNEKGISYFNSKLKSTAKTVSDDLYLKVRKDVEEELKEQFDERIENLTAANKALKSKLKESQDAYEKLKLKYEEAVIDLDTLNEHLQNEKEQTSDVQEEKTSQDEELEVNTVIEDNGHEELKESVLDLNEAENKGRETSIKGMDLFEQNVDDFIEVTNIEASSSEVKLDEKLTEKQVREKELAGKGITDLKRIAKNLGIVSLSGYKSVNKYELVPVILENEFSNK